MTEILQIIFKFLEFLKSAVHTHTHAFMLITVQLKYFKGYKFHRFRCFPAKRKNYFFENEWTPIVTWLNYACNPRNFFPRNQNFDKSSKFIVHKIFVLYGISLKCAL